ncbi:hypothetical protein K443DRAFT_683864 [Laccaria amethystina LaAM-08-1]|uniref:Uncharacterized protein n=1 Tax=Laccaria amethystina LaAM-08-1 TaxID=1095629 RepID=A0A0C9X9E2_9AGAR|nr:hypothetical protein K443DRAFT_683864 [Laccaria amethystina LaAM-08-1]
MAERCSQCSDSVLGPDGRFVFVFGWVGYKGRRPTRRPRFGRGGAVRQKVGKFRLVDDRI